MTRASLLAIAALTFLAGCSGSDNQAAATDNATVSEGDMNVMMADNAMDNGMMMGNATGNGVTGQ